VTLFKAARRSGRRLIIDLYTAAVLEATGHPSIPKSDWDAVSLFVPSYQKKQIIWKQALELLDRHKKHRIFPEELASEASRSVLLFRTIHQKDLVAERALKGARLFFSMWEGYLKRKTGIELQSWADTHGVSMTTLHTSGHASPADLSRFVRAINPRALVPIHSFQPERFEELFSRVERHEDGEWW
jgi:ribonuclease J